MTNKVLITLWRDTVAPRFDLASEVLIATRGDTGIITDRKTLVLPSVSPEDLCRLILAEGIDLVICNGIEKEYYEYLNWKKIEIIDSNVRRLYTRLFNLGNSELKNKARLLVPNEAISYNEAILDFSAIICKSNPLCDECVLLKYCSYSEARFI